MRVSVSVSETAVSAAGSASASDSAEGAAPAFGCAFLPDFCFFDLVRLAVGSSEGVSGALASGVPEGTLAALSVCLEVVLRS